MGKQLLITGLLCLLSVVAMGQNENTEEMVKDKPKRKGGYKPDSPVIQLDDSNFDDLVLTSD
jgi:hypothetical protein